MVASGAQLPWKRYTLAANPKAGCIGSLPPNAESISPLQNRGIWMEDHFNPYHQGRPAVSPSLSYETPLGFTEFHFSPSTTGGNGWDYYILLPSTVSRWAIFYRPLWGFDMVSTVSFATRSPGILTKF